MFKRKSERSDIGLSESDLWDFVRDSIPLEWIGFGAS